jgi:hypothetical protein
MTHLDVTDLSSVTTRPQPGSANVTRLYREGVFIGRVCGQSVYDATGRLRCGDDFERIALLAVREPAIPRTLAEIATEIRETWPRPYFGAVPCIEAMSRLDKITDRYGLDDGETIVRYFLVNAQTWRGPVARRVKAELRELLKGA